MSQFDAKAAEWDDDPRKVKMAEDAAVAITGAIALNDRMDALEVGCGTGLVATQLSDKIGSITAVDTSEGMQNVLREKIEQGNYSNITPILADLTQGKAISGQFDLIYSVMTFHHIRDIGPLLKYFYDLLVPGGKVVIIDLDAEDGGFHKPDAHYEHKGFGRDVLKDMLSDAGLVNVTDKTAFEISKETDDGTRDFSVFLMTSEKSI